jgi:hypothetical protein
MKKFHQPNSDQNFDFEERILILNNLSHNKKYIYLKFKINKKSDLNLYFTRLLTIPY